MQKDKLQFEQIKRVTLLVAFGLSIIFLILNTGFYFTSFRSSFVVRVSGELANQAIDSAVKIKSPAKVDRATGEIYYQYLDSSEFNQIVTKVTEEYSNAEVDQVNIEAYLNDPAPIMTLGSNSSIFAITLFLLVYLLYVMIWKKLDKQDRLKILLSMTLSLILGVLASFGLLSVVSMITMISEFEIFMVILATIVVFLTLISSIREYIYSEQVSRVNDAIGRILDAFNSRFANQFVFIFFGLTVLMVSLGIRFVLPGLVFLSSVAIIQQSISVLGLPMLHMINFDWKHVGGQINVSKTPTSSKVDGKKVSKTSTIQKKKNKSKKK